MTMLSVLTDTVLVTSLDDDGKKKKLAIVAAAIVGISLLLRCRKKGDKESEEEETESESEDEEEDETDEIKESAKEELAEAQRELDAFDILAILASAIKAARDEYDQRAE